MQEHIRASNLRVDVVIVSPLTRALETAVGCFGNFLQPSNGTPPLMMEITEQPGVRAAHPAVSAEGCPPFVAYEMCREHLGVHPCDRRYNISRKQAMFPGVWEQRQRPDGKPRGVVGCGASNTEIHACRHSWVGGASGSSREGVWNVCNCDGRA